MQVDGSPRTQGCVVLSAPGPPTSLWRGLWGAHSCGREWHTSADLTGDLVASHVGHPGEGPALRPPKGQAAACGQPHFPRRAQSQPLHHPRTGASCGRLVLKFWVTWAGSLVTCSFAEFPSSVCLYPGSHWKWHRWARHVGVQSAAEQGPRGSSEARLGGLFPFTSAPIWYSSPQGGVSGRGSGTRWGGGLQGFLLWIMTSARLTWVPALYQLWAYPF